MEIRNVLKGAAASLLLSASISATASVPNDMAPIGFDQIIVYLGTGVMDFSVDEPREGIDGCTDGVFCTNLYFQMDIMHKTDAEIAALEQEAKDFFEWRFGIAVDEYVDAGLIRFRPWTLHPDLDYRTYYYDGNFPPQRNPEPPIYGWNIRDGGWIAEVIAPGGLVLGGEFEGTWIPEGSSVLKGNYNILATRFNGAPVDEIVIHYRSLLPIVPRDDGSFLFRCELDADDIPGVSFDEGFVFGHMANEWMPDGRMKGNGRNVLTFPKTSRVDNILDLDLHDVYEYIRDHR